MGSYTPENRQFRCQHGVLRRASLRAWSHSESRWPKVVIRPNRGKGNPKGNRVALVRPVESRAQKVQNIAPILHLCWI